MSLVAGGNLLRHAGVGQYACQGRRDLRPARQAPERVAHLGAEDHPAAVKVSYPDGPKEDRMSLFKQFTHVSVTVTDVAKAREFYSNVLGFEEIARTAFNFPGIWYSLGGDQQLHLILNDEL